MNKEPGIEASERRHALAASILGMLSTGTTLEIAIGCFRHVEYGVVMAGALSPVIVSGATLSIAGWQEFHRER